MMAIPSIDMKKHYKTAAAGRPYRPRPAGNFRFHHPAGNLQVAARHRHAGNRQPGRAGSGTACVDR